MVVFKRSTGKTARFNGRFDPAARGQMTPGVDVRHPLYIPRRWHRPQPYTVTPMDDDEYTRRMTALNARLQAALGRSEAQNAQWRSNFKRSLDELKKMAVEENKARAMSVATPSGFPVNANRERSRMGIKEIICGALESANERFCTPTPTYPKLCDAIAMATAALGCNVPEPPQGCSVTGCITGYYCDPVSDTCLLKKPSGAACVIPSECQSGDCQYNICV